MLKQLYFRQPLSRSRYFRFIERLARKAQDCLTPVSIELSMTRSFLYMKIILNIFSCCHSFLNTWRPLFRECTRTSLGQSWPFLCMFWTEGEQNKRRRKDLKTTLSHTVLIFFYSLPVSSTRSPKIISILASSFFRGISMRTTS